MFSGKTAGTWAVKIKWSVASGSIMYLREKGTFLNP